MLKHKLRKSRKNILSLLDYAQEQEENDKFPDYAEIKKPSRKEKKKKGTGTDFKSHCLLRPINHVEIMFTKTVIWLVCIIGGWHTYFNSKYYNI